MGEQFKTLGDLENEVNLNYRRLQEARANDGKPLQDLFEKRMNDALDMWAEIYKWTGQAALLGEQKAA